MAKVITIGRQFGSNGRAIAMRLADELDIGFYDKQLIAMAADKSEMDPEVLLNADEKKTNPLQYAAVEYRVDYGYSPITPVNDVLFNSQAEIIQELAQKEDCVIVGRCANAILADESDCRHIFIQAPLKKRIETVQLRDHLSERDAKAQIKKMDKQRRLYYNYYTDHKWGDLDGYHLGLDSGSLSEDDIIDILKLVYSQID